MSDKEEWTEVEKEPSESKENKVEFEVEGEEVKAESPPDTETKKVEEKPKELEGIETKGAEKRIRQLIKQRKDRDEHIQQLVQKNDELVEKLTNREQEFTNISKMHLDVNEKQLTDKLELARAAYKSAHEEGDSGKILQAQEVLNEAQTDIKSLNVAKVELDTANVAQPQQPAPQQQQQNIADPRAVEWSQNNDWFGKDRIMTAAALALDAELKEEGFSPNDPEFYNEIDNRINSSFIKYVSSCLIWIPRQFNCTSYIASCITSRREPRISNTICIRTKSSSITAHWHHTIYIIVFVIHIFVSTIKNNIT